MKKLLILLLLIPGLLQAQIWDTHLCGKPLTGNPVANAGGNQTIGLPTTSITLSGTGTPVGSATISSYAWVRTSGPNTPTIVSPSSAITNVTGLIAGTYVFTLTVTDNNSLTGTNSATITVNPAPVISVTGTLSDFGATVGTNSSNQSVTTSITNAQGGGTVTSPPGGWLELSLTGTGGWASSVNTTQSGGGWVGQPVSIFTRTTTSAAVGNYSGNIAITSANATTVNVAATATIASSGATNDTININLTDGSSAGSMHQQRWNNFTPTANATSNQTSATLSYATGILTAGITVTLTESSLTNATFYDNTLAYATGNTSGYPDTAFKLPFGYFDDGPDSVIFNNLPAATNNYTVIIGSSRNTTIERDQTFICNGVTVNFNAKNNINNVIRFTAVPRNGSNKIVVKFFPTSSGGVSYANFITLIKNN